jgi:hypothetical protein
MRPGLRVLALTTFVSLALAAPAAATDRLSVFADANRTTVGSATTIGAHVETDAGYGGGRVLFKYKPADQDCRPEPTADDGADANPGETTFVDPGPGSVDVGGQLIQFDLGSWRVCAWLLDDGTGAVVASGATVIDVVPYSGSLKLSVKRTSKGFQVNVGYTTSARGRLYAALQRATKRCPLQPTGILAKSVRLTPRTGVTAASNGRLTRPVALRQLSHGTWRVCAWLQADAGSVGPATKAFAVPRPRHRGGRAGG